MVNDIELKGQGNITQQANNPIGTMANNFVTSNIFETFRDSKAANTIKAYDTCLKQFATYLQALSEDMSKQGINQAMPDYEDLAHNPQCWQVVTFGLVETFINYLKSQGYALSTINVRLSALKAYSEQAHKAGHLVTTEYQKIQAIENLGHRVNEKREVTRTGDKKSVANTLSESQAVQLKNSIDTTSPQGLRDKLLVCLMLDHGLRVSEVKALTVSQVDLEGRTIKDVYRQKVNLTQNLELTSDSYQVLKAYLQCENVQGQLIHSSLRDGSLTESDMSLRTIRYRIKRLGKAIGIDNLSPHDLRHTGATLHYKEHKDVIKLRDWGGWASLAMPSLYADRASKVKGVEVA